jgi:hypothetical protein
MLCSWKLLVKKGGISTSEKNIICMIGMVNVTNIYTMGKFLHLPYLYGFLHLPTQPW